MQDLVSIIMPSYNSGKYIARSIESILSQTYQNWELLITDDNSKDDTQEILRRFAAKDFRVRVFQMTSNKGPGYARNYSIEQARGRYIAFCDSDDCWLPMKLEKQLELMREKDCALSYSSYFTCSEKGEINGIVMAQPQLTLRDMKHDNKIGCLTAIYDTQKCGKVFMPTMRKRQDWALLLHIMKHHPVAYGLTLPMAVYRLREFSVSHSKFSLIKYNAQVYREVFDYSTFHSYAYLFGIFMPTYFSKCVQNMINTHRYENLWAPSQKTQNNDSIEITHTSLR